MVNKDIHCYYCLWMTFARRWWRRRRLAGDSCRRRCLCRRRTNTTTTAAPASDSRAWRSLSPWNRLDVPPASSPCTPASSRRAPCRRTSNSCGVPSRCRGYQMACRITASLRHTGAPERCDKEFSRYDCGIWVDRYTAGLVSSVDPYTAVVPFSQHT